ncbi:nucleotide-diphospho-sugar transferase-domain-containing protein [Dichotomocladium elegans]|nr:nucleotide-diphospho-sugar transferase-domain-containing protein [Dichotomocladium elegans]
MGIFYHSSRRAYVLAAALLVIFLMAGLNYTITFTETSFDDGLDNTTSPLSASADDQSSADPWYCSCTPSSTDNLAMAAQEQNTTLTLPMDNEDYSSNNNNDYPAHQSTPLVVPEVFMQPDPELIKKIDQNLHQNGRVLIVATANYGMRDHVYNWIESLRKTGESDRFLIFCLDDHLYEHLSVAGFEAHAAKIPESWFHDDVEAGFEEYYSAKYRIITHAKTLIVQQLLYLDITVLFSDVDIVWLRPRLREYIHTFLQIRGATQAVFQQEGSDQRNINSGFYMIRPTEITKRLMAETIYLADTDKDLTQQAAMNIALSHLDLDLRSTGVVLLDILHFPNGFIYFENNWCNNHGIEPYIVHANYLVGKDKRKKLEEHGLWYVSDKWLAEIDGYVSPPNDDQRSNDNEDTNKHERD